MLSAPPSPLSFASAPRFPSELRSFLSRFSLAPDSLLTSGLQNAKLAKGSSQAFSALLHLLPDKGLARAVSPSSHAVSVRGELPGLRELAQREGLLEKALSFSFCPFSSPACRDLCLAFSGHGGLSVDVASCRARRSLAFLADREAFCRSLLWASGSLYRKATKKGLPFALRLNGTQELPWPSLRFSLSEEEASLLSALFSAPIPSGSVSLPEALASVPFLSLYDYSKGASSWLEASRSSGIHTTASLAADAKEGAARALDAIGAGFALAVPVMLKKGEPLPKELLLSHGSRSARLFCIDGDQNDLRMSDPEPPSGFSGLAVMLRLKKSRGASPSSAARFALAPSSEPQALAGGGEALLSFA